MKALITIIFITIFCSSYAQSPNEAAFANGIYISSSDYIHAYLLQGFNQTLSNKKHIESWGHSHQIRIKDKDSVLTFYYSDIWGYRKDGKDYRIYNGTEYSIADTAIICMYSVPIRANGFTGDQIYFSKDLNSPVYELSKNNLINIFHDRYSFTKKMKDLHWYESVFKWDKKQNQYLFITWLSE